jgi:3-phenylpropionate/trans-cinnamate dioxygenase ferredoxin reductase component
MGSADGILIIGAGQAAAQAAITLREEGFTGAITIYGDEPHIPYQRPPLSKKFLLGEISRERLHLRPQSFYHQHDVTLNLGQSVVAIDRRARTITLGDGRGAGYDKLLIATGARAREIKLPGVDLENVHYLRTIADVDRIRSGLLPGRNVVPVGGGYIGLEVAAAAGRQGCKVTVLEMADRVMNRVVSEPVSEFYQQEHRKAGVSLTLNARVAGFEGVGGRLTSVHTTDGRYIPADLAIIGVGVDPNIALAEAAGLTCRNGIVVDEFGTTSDPSIFAAGDCTNHPNPFVDDGRIRLESVQNAIDQARHAARAMLGKRAAYGEVPWFWSDQYDLKLQIAGIRASHDDTVIRGDPKSRQFAVFYLRGGLDDGRIVAVESVNAVSEHMIGRKLIAARARVCARKLADLAHPMKSFLP